jgi:AbrB family looped-hinge helix DNA binding protein
MLASRISTKGQVTIPKKVRDKIGTQPGDTIVYEIHGKTVHLRRAEPLDLAFHAALSGTMDEWASQSDDEAFRDL